ncbi:hypothetical protein PV11_03235 [Exophiala sideris]|uniref:Palmitoyltransferase n=1 Tax=Exophiala sideris TaxID=1016849 RepID=A0A0D1WG11_9EURO|nr:hypothetical protein PV11_03235 [Exophiala sideris]
MASYSTPSSSPPPPTSRRRLRSCAQKVERGCCTVATYCPLAFVYGLSTWAVWTCWSIGFGAHRSKSLWWLIQGVSLLSVILYCLANLSYTVAVFTDPGSPLDPPRQKDRSRTRQGQYSVLPTAEPSAADQREVQNITVSSTGAPRYCKKCHVSKPDRAHHCSTCKRCVLKMDHHCPWLSTCLGLHNYKAFVLFLIYISLFSWTCFANSAWWMWKELFEDSGYLEELAPVSTILLAVIAGIMGLVITGFTAWHIYLCVKGQTTIEKLEKTRYLSGVRSRIERNRQEQHLNQHRRGSEGVAERLQRAGDQILEIHANMVPGASRYEEGEEHTSPVPSVYDSQRKTHHPQLPNQYAPDHSYNGPNNDSPALRALRSTYSSAEAERERARYDEYLDDQESEKMPNAFDLGWRRNLSHLFGPNPLVWWLPVCNTTGDGWRWEVSEKWRLAVEEAARQKESRLQAMASQGYDVHGVRMRGGGNDAYYERDRDHDYNYEYDHATQQQRRQEYSVEMSNVSNGNTSTDDSDSDVGYTDDDDPERGWERRNRARYARAR